MTTEKNATTTVVAKKPNKSAFVRQHANLPAAEVVAKAKEAGLTLSANFVSAVRSRAKEPKKPKGEPRPKSKGKRGPKSKLKRKAGRKPKAKPEPKPKSRMSASDFVRSMPAAMKAKEVVTAAKAKGIKLSPNLVYMVRSTAKKNSGRASAVKRKSGRKPRVVVGVPTGNVSAFKKMALDLGIATAKQALDDLERRLAELIAG